MEANTLALPASHTVIAASLRTALAAHGDNSLESVLFGLQQITELENPIPPELEKRCDSLLSEATDLVIDCQAMREVAADLVRTTSTMSKNAAERRLEMTRPFDAAKGAIMGWVSPLTSKLDQATQIVKEKIRADVQEQARIAAEAQRQAEVAAAAERGRIAAAAAEAQATAEAAAKKLRDEAAAAAAAGDTAKAARLEQRAEAKEEAGQEKVQQLHTEAAQTVAPVIVPTANRVSGISTREKWVVQITDKMALIKFVAEHPEHIHLLDANESNLKAMAKVQKAAMSIPGVKAYDEGTVSARRIA